MAFSSGKSSSFCSFWEMRESTEPCESPLVGQRIFLLISTLAVLLLSTRFLFLYKKRASKSRVHYTSLPPEVEFVVPLLGHILGFLLYGVCSRTTEPIYTVKFLWIKVHVAKSDHLISLINRQPKDFSFYPFALDFMALLLDFPSAVNKTLNADLFGDGYMKSWHNLIKNSLHPSQSLKHILRCGLAELDMVITQQPPLQTGLREWTDELTTRVGAAAFWGPENPFAIDPALCRSIKTFAESFHKIALYPLPRLTASRAIDARETMFSALYNYYRNGGIDKAPPLMQKRLQMNREYGISVEDTARLDIPIVEAVLANTVPLTLWMLHYIFANQALHTKVRTELLTLLHGNILEWKDLRKKCPFFVATWYEVLRITVALPMVRTALNDVMLDGKYFIKKDDLVIISPGSIHSDFTVWGSNVSEFDPTRFLAENMLAHGKGDLRSSVRAFGGGQSLCSGRFFSFHEVMAIVATLILRFEIKTADGSRWEVPKMNIRAPSLGVGMPVDDLKVVVETRPEFKGSGWEWDLGDMMQSHAF